MLFYAKSSIKTVYYYCYVSALVLLGFLARRPMPILTNSGLNMRSLLNQKPMSQSLL